MPSTAPMKIDNERGARIKHERVLVEVLTFEGCPHAAPAIELASRVAAEAQVGVDVRVINVAESEAELFQFLGSPSIRVHGHDVEPGADSRRDYAHSCRLYNTSAGLRPLPEEAWLHDALTTIHSPADADGP